MKVLVIGGSVFVGRHVTDALLAAGHTVTHFNRGLAGSSPRDEVETIRGDRMRDLDRLGGRTWDAVVDTCAYVPGAVELSTQALASVTGRYLMISTVSVYDYERTARPVTESSPLMTLAPDADRTAMTPETYGALKVLCEEVVERQFGRGATLVRAGLIAGPYDRSDRFTYWVMRGARGGRVLAPDGPDAPMQFIDVRDLAAFVVRSLENGNEGAFNVTGMPGAVTFGTMLENATALGNGDAEIVWCSREAISRAGVEPWQQIPLWTDDEHLMRTLHAISIDRALAAGLHLRPLRETIADTFAWAQTRPANHVMKHGMTPEREAEALRAMDCSPA
jgi:2'-hydroxyisoflavone reductase